MVICPNYIPDEERICSEPLSPATQDRYQFRMKNHMVLKDVGYCGACRKRSLGKPRDEVVKTKTNPKSKALDPTFYESTSEGKFLYGGSPALPEPRSHKRKGQEDSEFWESWHRGLALHEAEKAAESERKRLAEPTPPITDGSNIYDPEHPEKFRI